MKFDIQLLHLLRLRISGAVPPLPLNTFMALTGTTVHLTLPFVIEILTVRELGKFMQSWVVDIKRVFHALCRLQAAALLRPLLHPRRHDP
jgi:hypothetical protein